MIQDGDVYLNGQKLDENYIQYPSNPIEGGYLVNGQEVLIPEGHLFVMGDNRPRSSDSRAFGPIPFQSIIGKVFFRYFPTQRLGTIKSPY